MGAASQGTQFGAAAGNSTRIIFGLGFWNGCTYDGSPVRNKYTYATCASTASGVASASLTGYGIVAAGNSTRGIFTLGQKNIGPSSGRDKYTYATCTSTTASAASVVNSKGAAAGTSTAGIFSLGDTNAGMSTTRNKYTYATDTSSSATAASNAGSAQSAFGNSTRGIFSLGYTIGCSYSKIRQKYTYATDTNTTNIPQFSFNYAGGSGTGNSTRGIAALGILYQSNTRLATREKWTYATCTTTNCGVAAQSANAWAGSANSPIACINT